jgi:hypothetical protein
MKMADTKILKKLTIRTFIGKKSEILAIAMTGRTKSMDEDGKEVFSSTGKPVKMMRVLGQVSGFSTGESDFGSYVKLSGDFFATNMITGEETTASQALLPSEIGEPIANAIKAGASAIDFAVEVYVEFDESSATMYKFSARSLIKPETPKPITALMDRMASLGVEMTKPLAIAAPTLTPAQEAAQRASEAAADAASETQAAAKPTPKKGK